MGSGISEAGYDRGEVASLARFARSVGMMGEGVSVGMTGEGVAPVG